MFKKLIRKLYFKYCSPDIVAMTRLQMLGTSQAVEVLDLPHSERKLIAQEARTLIESEVLKLAFNNVKSRVMRHIQNEAINAEVIFYDRFSINGASLVEDELKSFAEYEDSEMEVDDELEII